MRRSVGYIFAKEICYTSNEFQVPKYLTQNLFQMVLGVLPFSSHTLLEEAKSS
jgi:hypothetical protein